MLLKCKILKFCFFDLFKIFLFRITYTKSKLKLNGRNPKAGYPKVTESYFYKSIMKKDKLTNLFPLLTIFRTPGCQIFTSNKPLISNYFLKDRLKWFSFYLTFLSILFQSFSFFLQFWLMSVNCYDILWLNHQLFTPRSLLDKL